MSHDLDRQFALMLQSHREWNLGLTQLILTLLAPKPAKSESTHE
jgi:hypothetical protein